MANPQYAEALPFILKGTHDSMIAHSVSPEADLFAEHRFPESTWILLTGEAFPQITEDSTLDRIVETGQLFECC